jgi:hypothetical protein
MSSSVANVRLPSAETIKTMQTFLPFYASQAMVDAGLPVVSRDNEGEPQTYAQAQAEFKERTERFAGEKERAIARCKEHGVEFREAHFDEQMVEETAKRSKAMLSAGTWSFLMSANHVYYPVERPELFDDKTLLRVALDHSEEDRARIIEIGGMSRDQLLTVYKAEMENSEGDLPIQRQGLMYLARGVLVAENWRWLSQEQLFTFFTAITGNYACPASSSRLSVVRAILREQVRMLEEMVDLRWTDEAEARGYNVLLELLRDNRRTLGLATGIKPQGGSKRKAEATATATEEKKDVEEETAAKKQK